jgi:hypothetical protein
MLRSPRGYEDADAIKTVVSYRRKEEAEGKKSAR